MAFAQETPTRADTAVLAEMKARLDRLEQANQQLLRQNQQLLELLHQHQPVALQAGNANDETKKIVLNVLKEQEDAKRTADEARKKEAAEKGYEVGSDTRLNTASWRTGGPTWESENKDFRVHIGGRLQFDSVWWQQPDQLKTGPVPGGNTGVLGSIGLGALDDGSFFRRARVQMDGQAYEIIEYNLETALEGVNNIAFDEFWAGVREVPFLGTIRVGQVKTPMGMESLSSSKVLPLLERSLLTEAFWQEFGTGVHVTNTALDNRMTWHYQFARTQNYQPADGADFGDGNYMHTARVTALPVWECNGREFLHLGAAYQFRTGDLGRESGFGGTGGGGFVDFNKIVRYRTRFEQRDQVSVLGGSPIPGTALGNSVRPVDTGNIITDSGAHTVGLELLYDHGPFWIQSEYTGSWVPNAIYPATSAGAALGSRGTPYFWGTYVMVGCFLTGEHRGYDRRLGRYDRVIPNENFFAVRDDRGMFNFGTGAWEVVYRYSYVDLNDNGIYGGQLGEHTVGLNWYLSPGFKFQFQYGRGDRNVPAPAISGPVQFVGLRANWDF